MAQGALFSARGEPDGRKPRKEWGDVFMEQIHFVVQQETQCCKATMSQ